MNSVGPPAKAAFFSGICQRVYHWRITVPQKTHRTLLREMRGSGKLPAPTREKAKPGTSSAVALAMARTTQIMAKVLADDPELKAHAIELERRALEAIKLGLSELPEVEKPATIVPAVPVHQGAEEIVYRLDLLDGFQPRKIADVD